MSIKIKKVHKMCTNYMIMISVYLTGVGSATGGVVGKGVGNGVGCKTDQKREERRRDEKS